MDPSLIRILGSMTDGVGSSGIQHVNSIVLANIYCFFNSDAVISCKGAKSFTQRSPSVFMFCYKRFFSSLPFCIVFLCVFAGKFFLTK